ncbi:hypothetical protein SDC9_168706 [bioreactor metagenome]|uniref:Uncharacterized protein n=1 Tax=bioreactor metagenome TaxID=1076179 RepID=A0A645G366_9ZZZZ
MDFIRGVDCNEYGSDFCRGPEGYIPLRHVGGPYCDMVAGLYSERDKTAGKGVDIIAELGICARIIKCRVSERVLIGKFIHHSVKHLWKRQIDEVLFFPHIFSGFAVVVDKASGIAGCPEIFFHIICKMREYHAGIAKIGRILFKPFKRNISFVINRSERTHHFVDREVTFAHHFIYDLTVFDGGILYMNIFYICSEVFNRDRRLFVHEAVWMM